MPVAVAGAPAHLGKGLQGCISPTLPFRTAILPNLSAPSIFPAFVINTDKSTFLLHLPVVTPTLPGKFSLHLLVARHAVLNTSTCKYSPPHPPVPPEEADWDL